MTQFADKAAGIFVKISVQIKRWEGIGKLKQGSVKAALDAGADPNCFNGYVALLGKHHRDLKYVKSLYMRLYTYLYENTLPFARGEYLIQAMAWAEVNDHIVALKAAADAARDEFLVEYERMVIIAKSSMGDWTDEVASKYPSAEAIRERFGAEIAPPVTLDGRDIRSMPIPVHLLDDIATEQTSLLEDQLANARTAAINLALKQMKVVVRQLDKGERLHATLISNSQRVADMLRQMTEGYDNDPRLLEIASQIEEKISCNTIDQLKNNYTKREESLVVARKSADALRQIAAAPAAADMSVNTDVADSGMLADLIG